MKTKRSFPIVTVTPKAETAIKKGTPSLAESLLWTTR